MVIRPSFGILYNGWINRYGLPFPFWQKKPVSHFLGCVEFGDEAQITHKMAHVRGKMMIKYDQLVGLWMTHPMVFSINPGSRIHGSSRRHRYVLFQSGFHGNSNCGFTGVLWGYHGLQNHMIFGLVLSRNGTGSRGYASLLGKMMCSTIKFGHNVLSTMPVTIPKITINGL